MHTASSPRAGMARAAKAAKTVVGRMAEGNVLRESTSGSSSSR